MTTTDEWQLYYRNKIAEVRKEFLIPSAQNSLGLTDLRIRDKKRKIVWASDFHIPFHNTKAIEEMLTREEGADILIVGGDLMDCQSLSTFRKMKEVPLAVEYHTALMLVQEMSKCFDKVFLIEGNHDFRFTRTIADKVPEPARFLTAKPILHRLADGEVYGNEGDIIDKIDLPNVEAVGTSQETRWYLRIGNTIFAHPTKFSKIEGKTAELLFQHFRDRIANIDSIVIGHIHKLGRHFAHGRLCVEGGCMCLPLDYSYHSGAKYSPTPNGYTVIVQDMDGNTDYNLSHEVFMGTINHAKELETYNE